MLQPGDRMPAFTLRDSSREIFTQEHLAGAPAVIAFFPMAFTGG